MRLIEWPDFLDGAFPGGGRPAAVTIGVFDGVHRGHRALIREVVTRGEGFIPLVVTFRHSRFKKNLYTGGAGGANPSISRAGGDIAAATTLIERTAPRSGAADPGRESSLDILSLRQKALLFEGLGVEITVVIEFTESFRRMRGAEFLALLAEKSGMGFLAVGRGFRCGSGLDTDAAAIEAFCAGRGISSSLVEALTEGALPVSSSRIRAAIARGDLRAAETMLGRPFVVDLADAAVFSPDGMVYSIAEKGRVLPPPGIYSALLLGKDGTRLTETPSEIIVKDGTLSVRGSPPGASPEYAEFLPL